MTFGELLRSARARTGKTLREFARQLELSPTYLSRVECGREQPMSIGLICLAAALLGADEQALLAAALRERRALTLATDLSKAHLNAAVLLALRWDSLTAEQLSAISRAIEDP